MINGFQISGDPSLCAHHMTGVSLKKPFSKDPYELLESRSHRCPRQTIQPCALLVLPAAHREEDLPPPVPPTSHTEGMQREITLHISREKLFAYNSWTAAVSPTEIPEGNMSAGKMTSDNPSMGPSFEIPNTFLFTTINDALDITRDTYTRDL